MWSADRWTRTADGCIRIRLGLFLKSCPSAECGWVTRTAGEFVCTQGFFCVICIFWSLLSPKCGWPDPHCVWSHPHWMILRGYLHNSFAPFSPTSFLSPFLCDFRQERRKSVRELSFPLKLPIIARNRSWNRASGRGSLLALLFGIPFSSRFSLKSWVSRLLGFSF